MIGSAGARSSDANLAARGLLAAAAQVLFSQVAVDQPPDRGLRKRLAGRRELPLLVQPLDDLRQGVARSRRALISGIIQA